MANRRVIQWSTMSRIWWLYDARHQCPFVFSSKIARYLEGKHKPIYHPLSDIGDHVVVINTKFITMKDERWRTFKYHNHTGYPKGYSITPAWRLHDLDPTRIVEKTVYSRISNTLERRTMMRRLHLYPDENVPNEILENVSDQLQQAQPVYRRLDEYTEEEIKQFPALFDWGKDYVPDNFKKPEKLMEEENKD